MNAAIPAPTDLASLEQLLDAVGSREALFGSDAKKGFNGLVQICHPDKFNGKPEEGRAAKILKLLESWRSASTAVKSKTNTYQLIHSLGTGDLTDVWLAVSGGKRYTVKIPRTDGCEAILVKEREIIEKLRSDTGMTSFPKYLPNPVESFKEGGKRVTVYEYPIGYVTVDRILESYPEGVDPRHVAWMIRRMLEILQCAHTLGYVHGAVLPPHLLFHPKSHGLILLGWTGSEKLGSPLKSAPKAYRSWFPPECSKKLATQPSTDLWMVAKTALHLLGKTPETPIKKNDPDIPGWLSGIVRSLTLESPRMRIQSASKATEMLDESLSKTYGTRRYVDLVL